MKKEVQPPDWAIHTAALFPNKRQRNVLSLARGDSRTRIDNTRLAGDDADIRRVPFISERAWPDRSPFAWPTKIPLSPRAWESARQYATISSTSPPTAETRYDRGPFRASGASSFVNAPPRLDFRIARRSRKTTSANCAATRDGSAAAMPYSAGLQKLSAYYRSAARGSSRWRKIHPRARFHASATQTMEPIDLIRRIADRYFIKLRGSAAANPRETRDPVRPDRDEWPKSATQSGVMYSFGSPIS